MDLQLIVQSRRAEENLHGTCSVDCHRKAPVATINQFQQTQRCHKVYLHPGNLWGRSSSQVRMLLNGKSIDTDMI